MSVPQVPAVVAALDGAELLDRARDAIGRHCVMPSQEALDAVTLWVAATHCVPAFDFAPRLVIRSAEKRSGKTRLLEVIADLAHQPLRAVNATVPAIFRSLGGDHPPTLLFDEVDTMFGTRRMADQNEELRGLINAGFQRGQDVLRTVGPQHVPTSFPTFAMAALAGIGRLPDTIEDRAVVIVMKRRAPGEYAQPYRLRSDRPALCLIGDQLAGWAESAAAGLASARPDLPVEDRAADTWEPLVAVADAAGGHWPATARTACKKLAAEASEADDEASLNVRLLVDVAEIFSSSGSAFLKSTLLVDMLHEVEDAPWSDFGLTANKLSRRLREYGVRPGRNAAGTERGYKLEDFADVFQRYVPDIRQKVSEPSERAEPEGISADSPQSSDSSDRQMPPAGSGDTCWNARHLTVPDTFRHSSARGN